MAVVDYRPDHDGTARLANAAPMSAAMVAIASQAKAYAIAISPEVSGNYKSSFHVLPGTIMAGRPKKPRAGAVIINTSPHAAAVEWHNGAAVLARTARTIDGRLHGYERSQTKRAHAALRRTVRASQRTRQRASQR